MLSILSRQILWFKILNHIHFVMHYDFLLTSGPRIVRQWPDFPYNGNESLWYELLENISGRYDVSKTLRETGYKMIKYSSMRNFRTQLIIGTQFFQNPGKVKLVRPDEIKIYSVGLKIFKISPSTNKESLATHDVILIDIPNFFEKNYFL